MVAKILAEPPGVCYCDIGSRLGKAVPMLGSGEKKMTGRNAFLLLQGEAGL